MLKLWPATQLEDSLWSAFHFRPGMNQLPNAAAFCTCSWKKIDRDAQEVKAEPLIGLFK